MLSKGFLERISVFKEGRLLSFSIVFSLFLIKERCYRLGCPSNFSVFSISFWSKINFFKDFNLNASRDVNLFSERFNSSKNYNSPSLLNYSRF